MQYYVRDSRVENAEDSQPLVEENGNTETLAAVPEETSTFQIVCMIWPWIITVFTTFTVTLMLFPAIAVLVESTEKGSVSLENICNEVKEITITKVKISEIVLTGWAVVRCLFHSRGMLLGVQRW